MSIYTCEIQMPESGKPQDLEIDLVILDAIKDSLTSGSAILNIRRDSATLLTYRVQKDGTDIIVDAPSIDDQEMELGAVVQALLNGRSVLELYF